MNVNVKNFLVGVRDCNACYCVNYVLLNFFEWFSGWCPLSQIAAFVLKFLSVEEKLFLLIALVNNMRPVSLDWEVLFWWPFVDQAVAHI